MVVMWLSASSGLCATAGPLESRHLGNTSVYECIACAPWGQWEAAAHWPWQHWRGLHLPTEHPQSLHMAQPGAVHAKLLVMTTRVESVANSMTLVPAVGVPSSALLPVLMVLWLHQLLASS